MVAQRERQSKMTDVAGSKEYAEVLNAEVLKLAQAKAEINDALAQLCCVAARIDMCADETAESLSESINRARGAAQDSETEINGAYYETQSQAHRANAEAMTLRELSEALTLLEQESHDYRQRCTCGGKVPRCSPCMWVHDADERRAKYLDVYQQVTRGSIW